MSKTGWKRILELCERGEHDRTDLEVIAAALPEAARAMVALEEWREHIEQDKDKDWSSCPDPNCYECREAKRLLFEMLDAIKRGEGPKR